MNKRNISLEYIRAFAMLGVIGIHTGAYSLSNPYINPTLFAILEIASRFSIPAFFFMSAFGLFWNFYEKQGVFCYFSFLKRRAITVIVPYLSWSFLYLVYYSYANKDYSVWSVPYLFNAIIFGLASYQLYFMVILIWFYLLMPVWRKIIPFIANRYKILLPLTLALQIILNYYLSYIWKFNFENTFFKMLWEYKLNYLILYYIFIFILGGVCSLHYPKLIEYLKTKKIVLTLVYLMSTATMLGVYYYFILFQNYSLLEAVFTLHQHSPPGVVYAATSVIFGLMCFSYFTLPKFITFILKTLAKQSYFIYLFHPFAMYFLLNLMNKYNLLFTSFNTIVFFFLALCISSFFAFVLNYIARFIPMIKILLLGNAK